MDGSLLLCRGVEHPLLLAPGMTMICNERVAPLPDGTVTLLFADLEGSTLLVRRLGAQWPPTLDLMRRACRQAWADHGGHEMGTEGDSFFVVFSTADAAVAAAQQVQRSLHTASWPTPDRVRLRVGVHTGSPRRHADGYIGLDVHTAARIAAAAAGGQVLLSAPTAALLSSRDTTTVRDLGEHQLKDIPGRVRLYRLHVAGIPEVATPPRTVGGAGKLPVSLTDFVGRTDDLEALETLLRGARLVTLTGPGGSGKTRLAVECASRVAEEHPDGIFFVPLASVSSREGMWWAMSQVLDIPADGQLPPGFFSYVAALRQLLVLDNLEQIEGARDVVRDLLTEAPHLTVLATSRGSLRLDGEHEYHVQPMGVPDAGVAAEELASSEAVQFFAACARRARRGFVVTNGNVGAIVELCRALDGLPLAIELAAARIKLFTPQALLARVDQFLDLDARDPGRDERQRTVRAAIGWSYALLDEVQRAVLDHLSVFKGTVDVEAVAAVVPAAVLAGRDVVDVLLELVDLSLVRVVEDADGQTRVALLEMVRRFAAEQLEASGWTTAAQVAHAQHYTELAEAACLAFRTGRFDGLADRLQPDLRNIAAVVERMPLPVRREGFPTSLMPATMVRAVCSLAVLFSGESQLCLKLTEELDFGEDPVALVGVLAAGHVRTCALWDLGKVEQALANGEAVTHGCASLERAGSRPAVPEDYMLGLPSTAGLARAVQGQLVLQLTEDREQAAREAELAIAAVSHLPQDSLPSSLVRGAASCLLASVATRSGQYEQARALYEDALRTARLAGDTYLELGALGDLVDLAIVSGDAVRARDLFRRLVPAVLQTRSSLTIYVAYTAAQVAALHSPALAARVLGALETREVLAGGELDIIEAGKVRAAVSPVEEDMWHQWRSAGRDEPLEDLMLEVGATTSAT